MDDDNKPLYFNGRPQDYRLRIEAVQSARQEASRVTYERALQAKAIRDGLVQPRELNEAEWVLVRHENPQTFESK